MRQTEEKHTLKRMRQWDHRDWNVVTTSQGMPGTTRNWKRQGMEGCDPADILISDIWPPEL